MMRHPAPLIYEEHCSVLSDWWEMGLRGRTVLYFDAHLDLQYINDERMDRLRRAETAHEFRALEKPSHLLPDGDYVYGLENFLYAASELGIIDHLIWVAPPHVDTDLNERVFHHLQQMDGVTPADIDGIRRTGQGCSEAELLGLKITFCRLQDVAKLDLPPDFLLDIDTDYFVALPEDRAWTDPAAVFHVLEQADLQPALISIARSVSSGFMPLRYRYFADYLKALWEADEAAVRHYAELSSIAARLEAPDDDTAAEQLADLLSTRPDCAATRHLYEAQPVDGSSSSIETDATYRHDPVRLASGLTNRHLAIDLRSLDRLYREFQEAGQRYPQEGHIAFGLAYAAADHLANALRCYTAYGRPHPALAIEIAQLGWGSSDHALLNNLLQEACREDPSFSLAHLLLAELSIRREDWDRAMHHLELAHGRAPAWLEPLQGLARVYGALGDSENLHRTHAAIRAHYAQRQRLLSSG